MTGSHLSIHSIPFPSKAPQVMNGDGGLVFVLVDVPSFSFDAGAFERLRGIIVDLDPTGAARLNYGRVDLQQESARIISDRKKGVAKGR
jgi:hypothetical protein